ncbi:hypothetical protein [Granulosicoccus antarcticus]|uniref:Uncharacterized protein n=1 Tax=Granulosicoccus antarcticus IMCC3135 TaxID=1192854 RepID=A0A2Z2P196_9GAMM|nr:hypothetical protein [Granulosicoccus antarcticus]ASJ76271.1 hypothetical protein IMCC3135_31110 [Granulosicoccus antarcticus IMCC3135]
MKVHKNYEFTEPELQLTSLVAHAKLRGTMRDLNDDTSVNGPPYELLLWFESESGAIHEACQVVLQAMTLKNIQTDEDVAIPESAIALFKKRSNGVYTARISQKNLSLDHAGHELSFNYLMNEGCGPNQNAVSVSMTLQKQYTERTISFWDTLMGV